MAWCLYSLYVFINNIFSLCILNSVWLYIVYVFLTSFTLCVRYLCGDMCICDSFLFPIWFSGITLQFILYCVSGSFDYFPALQLNTVEWALWFVSSCACVWQLLQGLYLEAKLLVHRLCVSRWNVARSLSRVALDISAPSSTESSYCFMCLQSLTVSFWIFANWNSAFPWFLVSLGTIF